MIVFLRLSIRTLFFKKFILNISLCLSSVMWGITPDGSIPRDCFIWLANWYLFFKLKKSIKIINAT